MQSQLRQTLHGIFIVAVIVTAVPVVAQPGQASADLKLLRENTRNLSVQTVRMLSADIKEEFHRNSPDPKKGEAAYRKAAEASSERQAALQSTLKSIAAKGEARRRELDFGYGLVKVNSDFLKYVAKLGENAVLAAVVAAPESAGATIPIAAVGYVAAKGLEQVEKVYAEAAREEVRRNLKMQLNAYRAKVASDEYLQLEREQDPVKFREKLEGRLGPVLGDALAGVDAVDRDIVNTFYNQELADVLKAGLGSLQSVQVAQEVALTQNRKDIVGLARAFSTHARLTQYQLEAITKTQSEIQQDLKSMNDRLGKTESGVAFMAEFLFGKMTPEERLTALNAGLFAGMPPEKEQELRAQISLEKKRADFNKAVTSYLNGAGELVNIARNLGVNPKIVEKANVIVNAGNTAFTAFQAFSSSNFLAGVSALSGLFGGGGRDIAGERHAAIMNQLGIIHSKLDSIQQTLGRMEETQRRILEAQRATYEAVLALSEQVAKNHVEVLSRLDKVHGDVLYNRRLIIEPVQVAYGKCWEFTRDPTNKWVMDPRNQRFPTLRQFRTLYGQERPGFWDCSTKLRETREGQGTILARFFAQTFESEQKPAADQGKDTSISTYVQTVYEPLVGILSEESSGSGPEFERLASGLLAPMPTAQLVEAKNHTVTAVDESRFGVPLRTLLRSFLAVDAVAAHANFAIDVEAYHQLFDEDGRLLTREELLRKAQPNLVGLRILQRTLPLVEVAIAQQTLLAGDVVLPYLYHVTDEATAAAMAKKHDGKILSREEQGIAAFYRVDRLVDGNQVLARNFLMYALRADVLNTTKGFLAYSLALGSSDPFMLMQVTKLPWQFVPPPGEHDDKPGEKQPAYCRGAIPESPCRVDVDGQKKPPKTWSVKLGGRYYALPSAEEMRDGHLRQQPDLQRLLKLRAELIDAIGGYEILADASGEQRVIINDIIVNTL